ncbi:hypothetical protein MAUB1S_04206 [Mycolicibacterium aubagnense]
MATAYRRFLSCRSPRASACWAPSRWDCSCLPLPPSVSVAATGATIALLIAGMGLTRTVVFCALHLGGLTGVVKRTGRRHRHNCLSALVAGAAFGAYVIGILSRRGRLQTDLRVDDLEHPRHRQDCRGVLGGERAAEDLRTGSPRSCTTGRCRSRSSCTSCSCHPAGVVGAVVRLARGRRYSRTVDKLEIIDFAGPRGAGCRRPVARSIPVPGRQLLSAR